MLIFSIMRVVLVLIVLLSSLSMNFKPCLASAKITSGEVDVIMHVDSNTSGNATSILNSFTVNAHIFFAGDMARIDQIFQIGGNVSGSGASSDADDLSSALDNFRVTTILDGSSKLPYILDEASRTAMRVSISDVNFTGAGEIGNPLDVLNKEAYPEGANIKKMGQVTFRGRTLTRYLISFTAGTMRATSEVYVDERSLPVYIQGSLAQVPFEAEYFNYRFKSVASSLFIIPADYEIVDMESVLRGMETKLFELLKPQ